MNTENKNSTKWIVILSIVVFLHCHAAHAQQDSNSSAARETNITKPSGLDIGTYEENVKRWQSLTEEERTIIRERARRLKPDQLKVLRERFEKFNDMPKEAQDRIKSNFQVFNGLSLEERNVLEKRYQRFIELPREKREELRHKFRDKAEISSDVLNGDPIDIVPGSIIGSETTGESNTGPANGPNNGSSSDPRSVPGRDLGGDGSDGGGGNGGGGNGGRSGNGGGGRSR